MKFKTTTVKSSLCDHSDAYILAKGTKTIIGTGADKAAKQADWNNKQVIFESYAPSSDFLMFK